MTPNIKDSYNSCAVSYASDSSSESVANVKSDTDDSVFHSVRSARIPTEPEDVNNLHVTGRVKFTYEIDRYMKNALLLFDFGDDDGDGDDGDGAGGGTSQNIRRTFEKFRFEANIHRNKSSDEVRRLCHEFFDRDFSEYGAVAVMMLTTMALDGTFEIPGSCTFKDVDLKKYFYDVQQIPSSLRKKPKILVTQSNNVDGFASSHVQEWPSETHTFELTLPTAIFNNGEAAGENRMCRPINFLCEKLERTSEQKDFVEIVRETITEARAFWPSVYHDKTHVFPFETTSTLNKHLYLWRSR